MISDWKRESTLSLSHKMLSAYIFVELCSGSLSEVLLGFLPSGINFANMMLAAFACITLLECRLERGYWLTTKLTLFHILFAILLALLFVDGFIERSGYSRRFFVSGFLSLIISVLVFEILRDRKSVEITLSSLVSASLVTCGLSMLLALPLGLESFIPHTSLGQGEISGGALGLGVNRQVTFALGPDITAMLALCSAIILCKKWEHGWLLASSVPVRALFIFIFLSSVVLGQSRGAYLSAFILGIGFVNYKILAAAFQARMRINRLFILSAYVILLIFIGVGLLAAILEFQMDRELARNFMERIYYGFVAGQALINFPFSGTSNAVLGGGHPHNAFFQVAITLGFPGLIALLIWITHFFWLAWSRRFVNNQALICIFLGAAVFLQNNFYIGIFQKVTLLILSIAICSVFIIGEEKVEEI